jgi:hypothetical protein
MGDAAAIGAIADAEKNSGLRPFGDWTTGVPDRRIMLD